MRKALKIAHNTTLFLALMGMLFGPMFWLSSYFLFKSYDELKANGKVADGIAFNIVSEQHGRSRTRYVNVNFHDENGKKIYASHVRIEAPLWSELRPQDPVKIYYYLNDKNPSNIRLVKEDQSKYVPLAKKRGLGKWMTLISLGYFILSMTFKYRIREYINNDSSYSNFNITALYRTIGNLSAYGTKKFPFYTAIQLEDSSWPRILYNPTFSKSRVENGIHELKNNIDGRLVPALLMVHPNSQHEKIIQQLKKECTKSAEWRAMSLISKKQIHLPKSRTVKVEQTKELNDWFPVVEQTLLEGHRLNRNVFQQLAYVDGVYYFSAFVDGKLVGTTMLFIAQKTAGIYLVGTHPDYRRKGVAKQIVGQAVNFAIANKCKEIHLQSTAKAATMYKSLGFKDGGAIQLFDFSRKASF